MQTLLAAIRAACSPQAWSRGVELSRSGAVVGERETPDEIALRVTPRRGSPGVAVSLFVSEDEWSCECSSREDACAHVAAAVIATHRARLDGLGLPRARGSIARVGYRFTRTADGLALERVIVAGKEESPLTLSLAERARTEDARELRVSPGDQAAEAALGGRARGLLSRVILHRVLAALRDCDDVQLDGRPATVGAPQPVMRARVERRAAGLYLSLVQDPAVHEVFGNGAVRCGNTLRPIGDLPMTQGEVAELRRGRLFTAAEVPVLLTEVIPELRKRIPVDLKGAALPQTVQMPPRAEIRVEPAEDGLSVMALLFYGDPPNARIDQGQLRHLRGAMPLRDQAAEAKLVARLERELGLTPGQRRLVVGSEAVGLATRLKAWEDSVRGDAHARFYVAAPLTPNVQIGERSIDVTFEGLAAEPGAPPPTVSASAVLRAWQRSEPMVPLLAGGWAPVPQEWLDRHGAQLVSLLAARDAKEQLPAHALPQLAALSDELEHPKPPSLTQLQARLADFTKIPAARLPGDLTAELRDYQRRGVDWLCFLRSCGMGAMLADDMGLGKTLQTLCAVKGRTLVVAPTSVLQNWAAEAAKFRPKLNVQIYHGAGRALDPSADLTLTTYALIRLDQAALGAIPWDTVVLDEAQAIKNPDSQVARAAFSLTAKFRIALTGTPVENRLDELWSQFHFVNPGLLGGRQDFNDTFARPMAAGEPGAAKRLQARIAPFVLRRLKVDVARELPSRTDGVLRCTLSEEERAVYDAILASTRSDVLKQLEAGGSVMQALEALLRLRQACCHAALIPGQKAESSAKLDLLCETLDSIFSEGHRALVFSQWTGLLDLLEPALAARKIAFTRLDGSTRDRGAVVRAFQAAEGPPLMLVSLKAGGTGLNLTAADHVFLLDPWWNPAVEDQAADRAHRIGQTRPVFVHRLVAEDTVEERILALQDEKRAIAVAALEGADRGASLTRDDLLALLR